jgi:predicted dinucleotide-binding enzyme
MRLSIIGADQTQAVVRNLRGKAEAGTPAQVAAFAEFIVLTTPWKCGELQSDPWAT